MSSRIYSTADEEKDLENDSVLIGLINILLQCLADCLSSPALHALLEMDSSEVKACISAAKKKVRRLKQKNELPPLSEDEAMAIHVYTQDCNVHKKLNELLRRRSRGQLKPFLPYLKLLLTALHKLTPLAGTVFRGVHADLAAMYPKGREIVWWGFSSTTVSLEVLQNPEFLGREGKRTLFSIETKQALDVERYSAIGGEQERLLLPGTCLVVKGLLDCGGGLTMVQLAPNEHEDDEPLIPGFAFAQHDNGRQYA